jgi:hypothetical protein
MRQRLETAKDVAASDVAADVKDELARVFREAGQAKVP